MASIFTKIINREIPGHIVAEDDRFIAFLDVMPLVEGHTLIVPKTEVDYIFDLDETTLAELILFAKKVAVISFGLNVRLSSHLPPIFENFTTPWAFRRRHPRP